VETRNTVLPSLDSSSVWVVVKPCLYKNYGKSCVSITQPNPELHTNTKIFSQHTSNSMCTTRLIISRGIYITSLNIHSLSFHFTRGTEILFGLNCSGTLRHTVILHWQRTAHCYFALATYGTLLNSLPPYGTLSNCTWTIRHIVILHWQRRRTFILYWQLTARRSYKLAPYGTHLNCTGIIRHIVILHWQHTAHCIKLLRHLTAQCYFHWQSTEHCYCAQAPYGTLLNFSGNLRHTVKLHWHISAHCYFALTT
jgi:hypothetical protein